MKEDKGITIGELVKIRKTVEAQKGISLHKSLRLIMAGYYVGCEVQPQKLNVNAQLIEIIVELHTVFNDIAKVDFWLHTKNLNLGGSTPMALINAGRGHKVLSFIKNASDGNYA